MATKKATAARKSAGGKTPAKRAAKRTSPKAASKSVPKSAKASVKKSADTSAVKPAKKSAAKAPGVKRTAKGASDRSAPKKASAADKYTDPALRDRIKAKVVREGKGGRPGQWSARKAQMVAHEYEAEGGKYKGGRGATQKSLTAWGQEHWTTQDGKPASREDGMHRYLPAKAWKELTPAQKRSTEKKKHAGDREGKQFVPNTGAAVKARRQAEKSGSVR